MVGVGRRGDEPSGFTSDWDFFMSTVPISLSKRYLETLGSCDRASLI